MLVQVFQNSVAESILQQHDGSLSPLAILSIQTLSDLMAKKYLPKLQSSAVQPEGVNSNTDAAADMVSYLVSRIIQIMEQLRYT